MAMFSVHDFSACVDVLKLAPAISVSEVINHNGRTKPRLGGLDIWQHFWLRSSGNTLATQRLSAFEHKPKAYSVMDLLVMPTKNMLADCLQIM